jgi:uncharacterized radical SAM superfamily Fe-S cluster-containing enzyme
VEQGNGVTFMTQDNRCTIPFTGLPQIHLYDNSVSPCCKVRSSPIDPVTGVLNKKFIELRRDIKDNKRNAQCTSCWKIDDDGGPSYRRRHSHHDSRPLDWKNLDVYQPVRNAEIAFSNKCQLMCVYCYPTVSSMWEDQQSRFTKFKGIAVRPAEARRIHDILDVNLLKNVQVTGGEPMLDQDCIDFMMALPFDSNRYISIITNLSYGSAVLGILNGIVDKHPNIVLMCSLDAIGENPTRKYLNWNLWDRNFKIIVSGLQERRKQYPNTNIIIKFTMNIMNYMNVRDIMEYVLKLRQEGFKGITFDINPISETDVTSMKSGIVDQMARIEINDRLQKLLDQKELNTIEQFNSFLQNVTFDPVLAERTEEYLKEYLK